MFAYKEIYNLIEDRICQIDYPSSPIELYEPIKYVLSLGGKRLRPCLAIMANDLFSGKIDDIIYPAIGIEIFHNFTLLHDDIMDKAPLRRNNSTVHVKWSESVAILSGDAMMIMAYDLITKTKKEFQQIVYSVFTKTAREVCEGQQFDMNFEKRQDVTVDEYMKMIGFKTASLIASALAIGAVTTNATEKDIELIYQFGLNIGIAFQLQDDYLDIYGESDKFGKCVGGDILSNKKTYLLLRALQSGNSKLVKDLRFWLSEKEQNPEQKIAAVTEIYNQLDIGSHSKKLTDEYFSKGFDCLNRVNIDEDRKTVLKDIVSATMKREK